MSERRSNWTLAAFAAPCLPLAGLGLPLVVYLPEFFASELGLGLAAVSAAFGAVRILDMMFDPIIGTVMDGTRSRFGRFRPWFVVGAPILMLATAMLFMARPGVDSTYLWMWLLVLYAGVSIATLSQLAWGAAISPEYNQRSRIYGWWQGGNVVGMILVLTLPVILGLFGDKSHAHAVAAMGWFVVLLLPLAVGLAVALVPEPVAPVRKERTNITEYFKLMVRPNVARLLVVDLLVGTGPAITGALFFFFFNRAKGFEKSTASQLLLIYFIGGLVGAPVWTWMARRLGKHRTLCLSSLAYAAVTMITWVLPGRDFALGATTMFLAGLTYSAGAFLLRAMMADVGDEVRLETGAERTALLYAMLTGTVKIGSAIAVVVTFNLLAKMGFDPKAKVGDAGVHGLMMMFTFAPASLAVLAAALVAGFPLHERRHGEIRDALAKRDLATAGPEMGAEPRFAEEIHVATGPAE